MSQEETETLILVKRLTLLLGDQVFSKHHSFEKTILNHLAPMSPNTTTVPLGKLEVLRNGEPNNQIREREMANIL